MRRNPMRRVPEGLALIVALVVALSLTVNAAVALTVGLRDTLWPVSLSAQFAGFFFFAAGLMSLAWLVAIFPLLARALGSPGQPDGARAAHGHLVALVVHDGGNAARSLAFVAGAAVAGCISTWSLSSTRFITGRQKYGSSAYLHYSADASRA